MSTVLEKELWRNRLAIKNKPSFCRNVSQVEFALCSNALEKKPGNDFKQYVEKLDKDNRVRLMLGAAKLGSVGVMCQLMELHLPRELYQEDERFFTQPVVDYYLSKTKSSGSYKLSFFDIKTQERLGYIRFTGTNKVILSPSNTLCVLRKCEETFVITEHGEGFVRDHKPVSNCMTPDLRYREVRFEYLNHSPVINCNVSGQYNCYYSVKFKCFSTSWYVQCLHERYNDEHAQYIEWLKSKTTLLEKYALYRLCKVAQNEEAILAFQQGPTYSALRHLSSETDLRYLIKHLPQYCAWYQELGDEVTYRWNKLFQ
jgi:hypothetical protein